eukprot:1864615-Prorocentrum_lima.AAC.1
MAQRSLTLMERLKELEKMVREVVEDKREDEGRTKKKKEEEGKLFLNFVERLDGLEKMLQGAA